MTNMQPVADRVLIKKDPEDIEKVSAGGIIMPVLHKERPQMGEVLAVGPEVTVCQAGDRVMYGKYAGTDLKLNEEEVALMKEGDILAIITETEDLSH